MPIKSINLPYICPFRLNETYDTLYELQQRLGISDEYLMTTTKDVGLDAEHLESLGKLLDASKKTRDNLITWHLKQTLVQLTVTISLLTAKIKFIEYKLGLCEGLDLHQACSLSLVNFCNILADMTVLNVAPEDRKTMHKISKEVDIPIWLSHYRNQICHVPSESPCISILVPLVIKSLTYMKDSFWSKVLARDTFNSQRCKRLILSISSYTNFTSINQRMELKKGIELGKKRVKQAKLDLVEGTKACASLRKLLVKNPDQVLEILVNFIVKYKPNDESKNCALLIEQVILRRCFERFVYRLLNLAEQTGDKTTLSWLQRAITLMSLRKKPQIKKTLATMNMNISVKMIRFTEIPALKCCQIAFRLLKLESPTVGKLIVRMRHKLLPILGKKRTLLLIRLTRMAKSVNGETKRM